MTFIKATISDGELNYIGAVYQSRSYHRSIYCCEHRHLAHIYGPTAMYVLPPSNLAHRHESAAGPGPGGRADELRTVPRPSSRYSPFTQLTAGCTAHVLLGMPVPLGACLSSQGESIISLNETPCWPGPRGPYLVPRCAQGPAAPLLRCPAAFAVPPGLRCSKDHASPRLAAP